MPASVGDFVQVDITVNGDPSEVSGGGGGPTPPDPGGGNKVTINGEQLQINGVDVEEN